MSEKHHIIMPQADFEKLIEEMRNEGYIVETSSLGYVCYAIGKHGVERVMNAMKGNGRYMVEAEGRHFELRSKA